MFATSLPRCSICGRIDDLRSGHCYDCADVAERWAIYDRGVWQHTVNGVRALFRGRAHWLAARIHLAWAVQRLTHTGAYERDALDRMPDPRVGR